jgi:hypothetical protein
MPRGGPAALNLDRWNGDPGGSRGRFVAAKRKRPALLLEKTLSGVLATVACCLGASIVASLSVSDLIDPARLRD